MIDTKKTVITALQGLGHPVLNEHFLTENQELPCITYNQTDDIQRETGEVLMYSRVHYSVKVWASSIKEITELSQNIDVVMRSLGFKRTSANELWLGSICQRELRYNALTLEIMEV